MKAAAPTAMTASKDPSWWSHDHSQAWERAKLALRRDWEQTKADFGAGGRELNQSLGNTLGQAAGREPIPRQDGTSPTTATDLTWHAAEPALRYGHGARSHHGEHDWNHELETKLREEWTTTLTDTPWERVKHAVRRGWDSAKK